MKYLSVVFFVSSVLIFPSMLFAQGNTNSNVEIESIRKFAEGFYQWYVPKALMPHAGPAWGLALRYKSRVFSSKLFLALKEDSDAQAKVSGEIVGLDFDPFLNTQDSCERYVVRRIVPENQTYGVEIFGICSEAKEKKPDVIAQVRMQGHHWVFINFLYPNLEKQYPKSANLLATLNDLREERK